MGKLNSNEPDVTDSVGAKLRRACDIVQEQYDDRWPARGLANQRGKGDYEPLDDVSREGRRTPYRKYPAA